MEQRNHRSSLAQEHSHHTSSVPEHNDELVHSGGLVPGERHSGGQVGSDEHELVHIGGLVGIVGREVVGMGCSSWVQARSKSALVHSSLVREQEHSRLGLVRGCSSELVLGCSKLLVLVHRRQLRHMLLRVLRKRAGSS